MLYEVITLENTKLIHFLDRNNIEEDSQHEGSDYEQERNHHKQRALLLLVTRDSLQRRIFIHDFNALHLAGDLIRNRLAAAQGNRIICCALHSGWPAGLGCFQSFEAHQNDRSMAVGLALREAHELILLPRCLILDHVSKLKSLIIV